MLVVEVAYTLVLEVALVRVRGANVLLHVEVMTKMLLLAGGPVEEADALALVEVQSRGGGAMEVVGLHVAAGWKGRSVLARSVLVGCDGRILAPCSVCLAWRDVPPWNFAAVEATGALEFERKMFGLRTRARCFGSPSKKTSPRLVRE